MSVREGKSYRRNDGVGGFISTARHDNETKSITSRNSSHQRAYSTASQTDLKTHSQSQRSLASPFGSVAEELEGESRIYVSVFFHRYHVGIAYLLEDTIYVGSSPVQDPVTLHNLKSKFPNITFITASEDKKSFLEENPGYPDHPYNVLIGKFRDFTFKSAIAALTTIEIEDMAPCDSMANQTEREMHLRSALDLENLQAIQACGGLLSHMIKNHLASDLSDSKVPRVRSLCHIPGDAIDIDYWTLHSLSIFANEHHPYSQGARKKEGLSVFGLFKNTMTTRGELLLKSWMRYPTNNTQIIQSRLDHIEIFSNPQNFELSRQLQKDLRSIKDTSRLLNRFYNVQANSADWQSFYFSLQGICRITAISSQLQTIPILKKIVDASSSNIGSLTKEIGRIVDLQESKAHHVSIQRGVNPELDNVKLQLDGLDEFLTVVASEDITNDNIPSCITEISYVYFPQLGYHLKVLNKEVLDVKSGTLGDLSFRFRADEFCYYKNTRTKELDEEFGDLQGMITDTENKIIRELVERILVVDKEIRKASLAVYELDCLLSMATASVENDLVKPTLVDRNIIEIQGGRHILQEICAETFISNDSIMKEESGRLHVLTGPNASGKSVYLKQVGIIAFLAHIGSFVPAQKATIGYIDKIFTRIDTVSSFMMNLSTFTRDTTQIARMLNKCTERSLLLVDEYGKGTYSGDGCSLLGSVLKNLDKLGTNCPRSIVSTHFHELFVNKMISETKITKFYRMNALQETEVQTENSSTLVFLYKVVPGVCLHSYGVNCAAHLGIPTHVLDRALDIAQNIEAKEPLRVKSIVPTSDTQSDEKEIFDTFVQAINDIKYLPRFLKVIGKL